MTRRPLPAGWTGSLMGQGPAKIRWSIDSRPRDWGLDRPGEGSINLRYEWLARLVIRVLGWLGR